MKIHGHVHALQMIIGTGSPTAGTKTAHANTMESATETEIGTASRGAMVVAVAAAAGDGGLEGLQVMHMHLEIGRWRKEWDFNQTLIFMTLHLWTFKNMVLFWFIIVYLVWLSIKSKRNCIDS
jgi:hypothetical protein